MGLQGHYAACCSDTWSSELGVLSRSSPILIISGKVIQFVYPAASESRFHIDPSGRPQQAVFPDMLLHRSCWYQNAKAWCLQPCAASQVVPRGTNGGVSLLGTLAGGAGGLAMGLVYLATGWLDGTSASSGLASAWLPAWGLLLGLAGTGLDSLLGATCQYSGYSQSQKRVCCSLPLP